MKRLLCLLLSLLLVFLPLTSCDGNNGDTDKDKGDSTQEGESGLPVGEDPVKDDLPWDELD